MLSSDIMFEKEGKKIENLKGNWNILFLTKSNNYYEFTKWFTNKIMSEKNANCIYLSVNRPYITVKEFLTENKIDEKRIQYLDAITKTIGGNTAYNGNCKFLESPTDLTGFGIGMTQAYNAFENKKNVYFILDTLSTLLVYNSPQSVIKFIHFLNNKTRVLGIKSALIAMKNDLSEQMIATISQFCDAVEEVGED